MNNNPLPWHQTNHPGQIKIASLNCAGLLPHLKDLQVDPNLREADMIALQETSLDQDHRIPSINGFTMEVAGRGKGKGVAILQKNGSSFEAVHKVEKDFQIIKTSSHKLDVINVYRSSSKSLVDASNLLCELINEKKATIIIGDFNVCVRKNKNNVITQSLASLGFQQLVNEATHQEGNVIDHVYWKNSNEVWEEPIIEQYSPYFSDHDCQLITMRMVI